MEFCGVFYETGYLRAVYDRIRKLFFVFLMAAVLTVGMMGQGMETINFGSVRLKDMAGRAVAEYAAGVGTTGSFMISVTEIQISADVSADLFTVPAVISERSEDLNTGNSAAVVLPVEDAISDALMAEETISNILPGEETVPDAPIIETILPNDPPISGELSDIPVIDENISDDPALEEGGVGDKTVIGGGFVTDASGMICGISDLSVISEDGYLILPSEGCRGIAAGAFASCKDIISEIYIPANISEIEERAFTDLTSLGWIEMETSSFMFSADNAHAVHPNHPEYTDVNNCTYMNEGVVVKVHAGQKYTSDGMSMAVAKELAARAGVPLQYFANRSDKVGGSTLGNLAMAQVSMNCVDIGLPQLAMHSVCETAGAADTDYLVKAMTAYFSRDFHRDRDGGIVF